MSVDVTATDKRRSMSGRVGPVPKGSLDDAWRRRAVARVYVIQAVTPPPPPPTGFGWTNSVFMATMRRLRSW